jgi:3'(2'), 5'-bisphosphate nucleotidase
VPPSTPSVPLADASLLDALTMLVVQASATILRMTPAMLAVRNKGDESPVTAADEAAETVILEGLARLLPGVPVVSEEASTHGLPSALPSCFVLVDPLDGTREFIAGRPEFTVNIAVVMDGAPVAGVVAAPLLSGIWRGIVGEGAERLIFVPGDEPEAVEPKAIRSRTAPDRLVATLSRSHYEATTEAFLARLPIGERMVLGSSAKFCLVAEGQADVYPRLSPIREWDIAAGHAVLAAAGGSITSPDGAPIRYGGLAQGFRVPAFVAWGDGAAARRF